MSWNQRQYNKASGFGLSNLSVCMSVSQFIINSAHQSRPTHVIKVMLTLPAQALATDPTAET